MVDQLEELAHLESEQDKTEVPQIDPVRLICAFQGLYLMKALNIYWPISQPECCPGVISQSPAKGCT